MSGLKDKASRINFTGLPGVVNSDAAVVAKQYLNQLGFPPPAAPVRKAP